MTVFLTVGRKLSFPKPQTIGLRRFKDAIAVPVFFNWAAKKVILVTYYLQRSPRKLLKLVSVSGCDRVFSPLLSIVLDGSILIT
ncbi:MAG: hypothetical protein M3N42_07940 [Cyanobacteriota bacterium]|nr:hypothetical protein [Cyanobacteriota bacterium]